MFKIKPLALALSPMGRGKRSHTRSVDVQVACDNCGKELVPGAAYCERCGARTRRAKRLVSLSIRVELLFFLAVVVMVAGFVWAYAIQK
jgi:uncharacterized OB-fold protein